MKSPKMKSRFQNDSNRLNLTPGSISLQAQFLFKNLNESLQSLFILFRKTFSDRAVDIQHTDLPQMLIHIITSLTKDVMIV